MYAPDCLAVFPTGRLVFRPSPSSPGRSAARPLRTAAPDPDWPQNQLPVGQVSLDKQNRPAIDPVSLERDARELAELSASIPADLERVNRGLLPKDVLEKLKRVEKLSKHLRSELTRQ